MTTKFWVDMFERVIWTFIEAFLGAWAATGFDFNKDILKAALFAAIIAVAKAILASRIGNRDSASSAPSV